MRGEAFSRIDKVVEEILDNDVDISEFMTDNPSIDDLLAPDTDEESVAYSNEEFSHLLVDKQDGELSSETSSIDNTADLVLDEDLDYEPTDDDNDLIANVTAEDMFESNDEDCQDTSQVENNKPSDKNIKVRTENVSVASASTVI